MGRSLGSTRVDESGADGLAHSLELPYQVFEDQRSGETLGILQKARADVEKLVQAGVNTLFITIVGVVFVSVYAFSVHWVIVPLYFTVIPLLGVMSSLLSRRIKRMQKQIVSETTALAGSTTESLRNIELVKSLGLAHQEIDRLDGVTEKIVGLELKKVRYLRSLSFIQGTTVNFLRTSILFVMLFLVFRHTITVGQFFALYIYSFFIFGPLQELGTVINVYREAEASLGNFEGILATPQGAAPRARRAARSPDAAGVRLRELPPRLRQLQRPVRRLVRGPDRADGGVRRPVGVGQDHPRQAAGRAVPPGRGAGPLRRRAARPRRPRLAARPDRLRHPGDPALRRLDPRQPALRQPPRQRRRPPRGPGQGRLPRAAGPRRPGPRHGDRRGRHEGLGGRAAAPVDRPRPAAARPAC